MFSPVFQIKKLKWCILAESDNESTPTFSPIKCQRAVKVKTLEEIKLEKIQAESAAYYSYYQGMLFNQTFIFHNNKYFRRSQRK